MKDETKGGIGSVLICGVMLLVIINMLNPKESKEISKGIKQEVKTSLSHNYKIKQTTGSKVMEGVTDAISDLLTMFED